eukprot:4010198-Heterocapsa_arctica.AAC.1
MVSTPSLVATVSTPYPVATVPTPPPATVSHGPHRHLASDGCDDALLGDPHLGQSHKCQADIDPERVVSSQLGPPSLTPLRTQFFFIGEPVLKDGVEIPAVSAKRRYPSGVRGPLSRPCLSSAKLRRVNDTDVEPVEAPSPPTSSASCLLASAVAA